jgi:FkbM family methyltransferase
MSKRDPSAEWQLLPVGDDTPEWLARLAPHLAGFSLKRRLILLDLLKASAHVDLDGDIRLSLHSENEMRRIKKSGDSDKPIADWVRGFEPGEVFYDVGANTGLFSLMAGRLHGAAVPTYAFEPSYSSYEALVRNVLVNGLSASVHPLPLALYSETGLKPLHYRSLEAGAAKHGREPDGARHHARRLRRPLRRAAAGAPEDRRGRARGPGAGRGRRHAGHLRSDPVHRGHPGRRIRRQERSPCKSAS